MAAPSRSHPDTRLLVIVGARVEALVSPPEALALAEAALRKTSNTVAFQDIRRTLALQGTPGTCLSVMYAALGDRTHFGGKVLSVSPQNFDFGLPSHQGGILLFENEFGRPVALINGVAITGLRTPAASAVATRTLSRPNAREMALIGHGERAARHIAAVAAVRRASQPAKRHDPAINLSHVIPRRLDEMLDERIRHR